MRHGLCDWKARLFHFNYELCITKALVGSLVSIDTDSWRHEGRNETFKSFLLWCSRKSKFDRIKNWIKLSRIKIRVFVKHGAFYWTVLVMVFLNTCIVATNHYRQPTWLTEFQSEFFNTKMLLIHCYYNSLILLFIVAKLRVFISLFHVGDEVNAVRYAIMST